MTRGYYFFIGDIVGFDEPSTVELSDSFYIFNIRYTSGDIMEVLWIRRDLLEGTFY